MKTIARLNRAGSNTQPWRTYGLLQIDDYDGNDS